MDRTPCYNTQAANWQQSRVDAAAAGADVYERTYTEMRVALLSAMQGIVDKVPGYMISQSGAYIETERPFVEEVVDAVDHVGPLENFLMVLKNSECPLVATLRISLADAYARTTADGVAEARGGYQ